MAQITAKVAVSRAVYSFDKPYDYRVPQELAERLRPGMRVLVPFGGGDRGSEGIVLALGGGAPRQGLKEIIAALDPEPVLSERALKLALWMRERYFCTVYDAVKAMLPAGLYYALRDCVALKPGVDREAALQAAEGSPDAQKLAELLLAWGGQGTWSRFAPPSEPETRTGLSAPCWTGGPPSASPAPSGGSETRRRSWRCWPCRRRRPCPGSLPAGGRRRCAIL